jgi:hypothetical protein
MEQRVAAVVERPGSSSASWVALLFSGIGLVLCALMAFGLLALPILQPLGVYGPIGAQSLDLWALVVGATGPIPAVVGIVLGWWARRDARKQGWPTRTATSAVVVGLVALGLAALGWAVNTYESLVGPIF